MDSYSKLIVWQRAMELVLEVYKLCESFPKTEVDGLCAQLKRAAVSIPSNIAEGRRRSSRRDYAHFVATADGSLAEVETQLQIAIRLGYISEDQAKRAFGYAEEVGKMLNALRAKLLSLQT